MIIQAITAIILTMFFKIGYMLYWKAKSELGLAEIFIVLQQRSEIIRHYETIRSLKLSRIDRRLDIATPVTPFAISTFDNGSENHETQLLPQGRRPNKLKQMLWNLEVLKEYITFTQQTLSTVNDKPEIHLFRKHVPHTNGWDRHIKLSKFVSASASITESALKIYQTLDKTVYRNVDLEMTMISLIKSARDQISESSETKSQLDQIQAQGNTPSETEQEQLKAQNDRLEAQIETELKDQVESEILMLVTILHNDFDQILEAISIAQRFTISHRLVMIITKLNWVSQKESAKRLRSRIIPIIKNLVFGVTTARQ